MVGLDERSGWRSRLWGYGKATGFSQGFGNDMKTRATLLSVMVLNLLSRWLTSAAVSVPPGSPASGAQAVTALGLELLAQGTAALRR